MIQETKRITARITQVIVGLSLALLYACSAQTQDASEQDLNRIHHVIESQYPEGDRLFDVQLPASYSTNSDQAYPVLFHFAFDNEALEWTNNVVQDLSSNGQIPEMIIVSLHHTRSTRSDIRPVIEEARRRGQADRFLDHIEKEVMPFLEMEYRITDDRILAGWSRFGIFTTFALAHKPELFSGYIVRSSAPDGSVLHPKLQYMMSQNSDLSVVFSFAIGTKGNERRRRDVFNNLESLLTQNAPSTLRWRAEVIEDAGHVETFQPGLRSGLLFYFH